MSNTVEVDATFGRIHSFVGDLITDQIKAFGAHTRPELAMLLSVVEPGDLVFDVGAHIGTFAAPLAQKVGASGKVLAIEALKTTFDVLTANIERLKLGDRLQTICTAIGTPGVSYSPRSPQKNSGATFFVPSNEDAERPTKTLNELASEYFCPRVVKLDIEGLELAALRGADAILKNRPILYIEISGDALGRYGDNIDSLDSFLSSLGYKFFRNVGDRNGAHDNYMVGEIGRLSDGGRFYDVLAIHSSDTRINGKIDEAKNTASKR